MHFGVGKQPGLQLHAISTHVWHTGQPVMAYPLHNGFKLFNNHDLIGCSDWSLQHQDKRKTATQELNFQEGSLSTPCLDPSQTDQVTCEQICFKFMSKSWLLFNNVNICPLSSRAASSYRHGGVRRHPAWTGRAHKDRSHFSQSVDSACLTLCPPQMLMSKC